VELAIIEVSARGVRVALGDGAPFWLPRSGPGIEWSAPPEIGAVVYVRVPAWLCAKHQQLQSFRYQRSMALYHPGTGLDPEKANGELPMAADNNDLRGALFKNDRKESDRHPDYKGDIVIDGRKFWLSGWIKEGKRGKFLSLAANPADEQRPAEPRQPERTNTYAQSTGRDDRQQQQRSAGGPTFREDDQIPFEMEWR
jgi:hypothetical protein